jgi:anti-sigma factor RsiW
MYQDATGRRLTLYIRVEPSAAPATAFRFSEQGTLRVFHWIDGSLGYALSGEFDREELLSIATRVHRQIAS